MRRSLATVVASAAVASVWAIDPTLTVREVLALVYKRSLPVGPFVREGDRATLCGPSSSCQEVRRVSVCEAMRAACAEGSCATTPSCHTVPAGHGEAAWDATLFERATDQDLLASDASLPGTGESALLDPWTHSQPAEGGCVRCSLIRSTGEVSLKALTGAFSSSSQLYLVTDTKTVQIAPPASGPYADAIKTKIDPTSTSRAMLVRNVSSGPTPSYLSEDIDLSD
jgi:hypothetical protein